MRTREPIERALRELLPTAAGVTMADIDFHVSAETAALVACYYSTVDGQPVSGLVTNVLQPAGRSWRIRIQIFDPPRVAGSGADRFACLTPRLPGNSTSGRRRAGLDASLDCVATKGLDASLDCVATKLAARPGLDRVLSSPRNEAAEKAFCRRTPFCNATLHVLTAPAAGAPMLRRNTSAWRRRTPAAATSKTTPDHAALASRRQRLRC